MSGRLVILPKKSYCPWKPENVERVLRDERLERERREKEETKNLAALQDQRLAILREQRNQKGQHNGSKSSNGIVTTTPVAMMMHVNLFQAEEEAYLKNLTTSKPKEQHGIMPIGLGQTELKARTNVPFYLKTHQYPQLKQDVLEQQKDDISSHKDLKRKGQMDPMKDFVKNELFSLTTTTIDKEKSLPLDYKIGAVLNEERRRRGEKSKNKYSDDDTDNDAGSDYSHFDKKRDGRKTKRKRRKEERREKKKRKKSSERYSTTTKTVIATVDELRRKRLEREAHESQRAMLVRSHKYQGNTRDSYQNQYNPGLSRK